MNESSENASLIFEIQIVKMKSSNSIPTISLKSSHLLLIFFRSLLTFITFAPLAPLCKLNVEKWQRIAKI